MRGVLQKNKASNIFADGRTYDHKLYTFKECDYKVVWNSLDILAKVLDEKTSIKNLPSVREDNKMNKQMLD